MKSLSFPVFAGVLATSVALSAGATAGLRVANQTDVQIVEAQGRMAPQVEQWLAQAARVRQSETNPNLRYSRLAELVPDSLPNIDAEAAMILLAHRLVQTVKEAASYTDREARAVQVAGVGIYRAMACFSGSCFGSASPFFGE